MASSLVKIDIHLIFHVKSGSVNMASDDLSRIFAYMGGIIRAIQGIPIEIGGMPDHVHILTSLPKMMSLSDFVRKVKAESSGWIRQLSPAYHQFHWQEGYGAFSVSPSLLDQTIQYIRHQETHHRKRTFNEEYRLFLEAYGIAYDERYAFET